MTYFLLILLIWLVGAILSYMNYVHIMNTSDLYIWHNPVKYFKKYPSFFYSWDEFNSKWNYSIIEYKRVRREAVNTILYSWVALFVDICIHWKYTGFALKLDPIPRIDTFRRRVLRHRQKYGYNI